MTKIYNSISGITLALILGLSSIALPYAAYAQTATDPNAAAATTPAPATNAPPVQFSSNGIAGCNRTGAAASSVAVFAAGGAYVPVSDAAVELNTGYLVYLACTLNPLMSALSGSATAGLVGKIVSSFNTGDNGNPRFSVNINAEKAALRDQTTNQVLPVLSNAVTPGFRNVITTSAARGYAANTQNPTAGLACPYSAAQTTNIWAGIAAMGVPSCDVILDAYNFNQMLAAANANALQNQATELAWGQGVYPNTTTDANGNVNVVTPGAIVLNQAQQALQAGLTKTENATSIGQMVSALFAGIGTQAISSAQGLAGLSQSINGAPPYIDQVAGTAEQGVQTSILNAAITELNGVVTTVNNYISSLTTIDNTFLQAINVLKSTEATCWNNIIQNVCVAGSITVANGAETCTVKPPPSPTGFQGTTQTQTQTGTFGTTPNSTKLKIATSTAFSNAIVQAQIAPSATIAAQNFQAAQATLASVNQLVAGVTSANPQAALQQLDQLTASNSFPSQADTQNAQQQALSLGQTMQVLINSTVQSWQGIDGNDQQTESWDGTVTPGVGWCNYNSQQTLLDWETEWKS